MIACGRTRNPFFYPLVGLVVGIYCQGQWSLGLPSWWGLLFGSLLALAGGWSDAGERLKPWLVVGVFVAGGGLLLALQRFQVDSIRDQLAGMTIDCRATVTELDALAEPRGGQLLELSVHDVRPSGVGSFTPLACKLFCYTRYWSGCQVGDTIELANVPIAGKPAASVVDAPPFQDYLVKEGAVASIFLNKTMKRTILLRPETSVMRWLWRVRHGMLGRIKKKLSPLAFSYFSLIFLGNKQQPEIGDLRRTFNYWGLSHYLARAGLHIVLFIFIWKTVLALLPFAIFFKRLLLILLCLVYAMLSWSSIPFTRALYSFLLIELGGLLYRQTDYFYLLTLICSLVLLFNPMQLFFLDFQLTFALTFALTWLARVARMRNR